MKRRTISLLCAAVILALQIPSQAAEVVADVFVDGSDVLNVSGTIDLTDSRLVEEKDRSNKEKLVNEFPPKIMLIVLNPGRTVEDLSGADAAELSEIINMYDVTEANDNGSFAFSNTLSGSTGTYTAVISSAFMGEPEIRSFEFTDYFTERLNLIKNSGNADEFKKYIEKNIYLHGFWPDSYISLRAIGKESAVIEAMMAEEDFSSGGDVKESFESLSFIKAFALLDDPDELYNIILGKFGDNSKLIQLDEFLNSVAFDEMKTEVMGNFLHKDFEGIESFTMQLADAVLCGYVHNISYYKKIEDVLSTEPFGFSAEYINKFKSSVKNKEAVLRGFFDDTRNVSDSEGIYASFNNNVDLQLKDEKNEEKHDSRGGGSYSGGKYSVSLPSRAAENNETQNQTQSAVQNEKKVFADVDDGHWASVSIGALAESGIIRGISENEFAPDESVTREQLLQMCMRGLRLSGVGQKAEFADVQESDWFYGAVSTAAAHKIILGTGDNKFGAGSSITRQDAAVILYRCASVKEVKLPEVRGVAFADYESIADYAKDGVDALSSAKIVSGMPDGSFMPEKTLTRAECAELVYKFLTYCEAL